MGYLEESVRAEDMKRFHLFENAECRYNGFGDL